MMKLNKLLKGIKRVSYKDDFEVVNVTSEIDRVVSGSVFIPIHGEDFDSYKYVDEAINKGAYIVDTNNNQYISGIIKQRFINNPIMNLKAIGVIGTNGKSSVVHYLASFFNKYRVAYIMNACFYINNELIMTLNNTTPNSERLMDILAICAKEKCEYFIMEISSHAIKQERISGLKFDTLIYTNISQDHLDYHPSIMEYTATKIMGTKYLKHDGFVLCLDEEIRKQIDVYQKRVINVHSKYEYTSQLDGGKRKLNVENKSIVLNVLSLFEVDNLMLAYAYLRESNYEFMDLLRWLMSVQSPKGRMQLIYNDTFKVIIDYAHTYMAYYRLCEYVKSLDNQKILVFGLGGNRDKYKREMIGSLVGKYFDYIIVTSDNPRNEDPYDICSDIVKGMASDYEIIINREEAIRKAISIVEKGGIIVIAGKGDEQYQVLDSYKIPFSDENITLRIIGECEE